MRFQEEGREWRLPGFLYEDDLILCGESEEDLRTIVGRFIELCRRSGLIVNSGKSKVMLLVGEEGIVWGLGKRMRLEHVSEFKYLGCILENSGTEEG